MRLLLVALFAFLPLLELAEAAFDKKLLLISMDGFRHDYLDRVKHKPNFERMRKEGVKAPYINNVFVTSTFPNHYTLATGLYEESHGIIGNSFYDPKLGDSFSMSSGSTQSKWWDQGEPVWITARKQGKRSGTYFWPGSEVELQGFRPNFYKAYRKETVFRDRVDEVRRWFTEEDVDIATLYFFEPDGTGHTYGPHSDKVLGVIEDLDAVLGYLLDSFEADGILDGVNIILTSDHGMTLQNPRRQVVNFAKFVNLTLIDSVPKRGSVCHVIPKANKTAEVYSALKDAHPNMTVYLREDIPERFHFKNNERVPDILILPDEGWQCANYNTRWSYLGGHGYDNSLMSMKPFFLARGPNFKSNYVSEPFDSVDIYPLMCKLTGLAPAPNNGSLEVVNRFVTESPVRPISGATWNASGRAVYGLGLIFVYILRNANRL